MAQDCSSGVVAWLTVVQAHSSLPVSPTHKLRTEHSPSHPVAHTAAVQERGRMLYKLADLVEQNAEELALLEALVSILRTLSCCSQQHACRFNQICACLTGCWKAFAGRQNDGHSWFCWLHTILCWVGAKQSSLTAVRMLTHLVCPHQLSTSHLVLQHLAILSLRMPSCSNGVQQGRASCNHIYIVHHGKIVSCNTMIPFASNER